MINIRSNNGDVARCVQTIRLLFGNANARQPGLTDDRLNHLNIVAPDQRDAGTNSTILLLAIVAPDDHAIARRGVALIFAVADNANAVVFNLANVWMIDGEVT
ncbi:hypothetical protein D3C84_679320 [compost metagenome]